MQKTQPNGVRREKSSEGMISLGKSSELNSQPRAIWTGIFPATQLNNAMDCNQR
jgi:hypothetical protein